MSASAPPSPSASNKQFFIIGKTADGKPFRPSDWAERLAGVMAPFRPGGGKQQRFLDYSPWCIPSNAEGVKCVVVHSDLMVHDKMAWDFVMNFAKDNGLQIIEACLLPQQN